MGKFLDLLLTILKLFQGSKKRKKNAIKKKAEKKKKEIDRAVSQKDTEDINRITADIINQHDDRDNSLPET